MWRRNLRRILRLPAVPPWFIILWGLVGQASTVAWVRDVLVARPSLAAFLGEYRSIIAVAVGFLWLGWLIVRRPRTVYLPEIARKFGERGLVIDGETFDGLTIEGPATLYLMDGTTFNFNHLQGTSFAETKDPKVYGAIGLRNCTIVRCTIRNIGFIGTPGDIQKIRGGVGPP